MARARTFGVSFLGAQASVEFLTRALGPSGAGAMVAAMLGGRLFGATGCVLFAAVILALTSAAAAPSARWRPLLSVPTIVDVVGPRADGRLVLATRRGLFLFRPGSPATEFARGP